MNFCEAWVRRPVMTVLVMAGILSRMMRSGLLLGAIK